MALCERIDDGTRRTSIGVFTLTNQVREHPTHALQVAQLGFDLRKPGARDGADGLAVCTVVELEQLSHFVEGEAQFLRAFNKAQALDHFDRIVTIRTYAGGYRDQFSVLVIANGLNPDSRSGGKSTNRQAVLFINSSHV